MEQETFNAIIEGEYSYRDRKAQFKYTILPEISGDIARINILEKAAKMIPQEEIDRIIFTRDGRIFVRDFCLSDHDYLNNIHFMLEKIGKMFNDKDIDTAYKELRSLMKL